MTGKVGVSVSANTQAVVTTDRPQSSFSWLRSMRSSLDVIVSAPVAMAAAERALQTDRAAAGEAMSVAIRDVLDGVFGEVYAPVTGNRAHLFRAGTGTGKSRGTIDYIASDPRTYAWDGKEDEADYPGPVVFLLPTYENIRELRSKAVVLDLDPSLSGKRLAAQARARGIIHVSDVDVYVASMTRKELKVVVYKGKKAAGCKRGPELDAMMEAGLPTSRLCRAGGMRCPFYDKCEAIKQRKNLKGAHIVFLPRSFLDLQVPEELEKVRLVIADEAVWTLLTHSTTFPLSALDLHRDPPRRLPEGSEMSAAAMVGQRDLAAPVVKAALLAGQDPAQALLAHSVEVPGMGMVKGLLSHSVPYAAIVTGAVIGDRSDIWPVMPLATIERICAQPQGEYIREEHRLWQIIEQGLDDPRAVRDSRIQLLGKDTDTPMIRLSWLSVAHWQTVPLLLLDASGDAEITRRVFPGREIVVHDVPVTFNQRVLACIDRRLSIRSIVPGRDATAKQLFDAAKLLHDIRCIVSSICGVHGYGRVLVGMPKKIRKAVQLNWAKPGNADFCHAGATAGLDFGRQHVAIVSIGRLEVPVSEIDAQTGALTAGDAVPEFPIDTNGTGVDEEGNVIYPRLTTRRLQMRDGSDVLYQCHEHAGDMARRVQAQHREENIRQLLGRIRSFYRTDTVSVYVIGQAIPEDLIVDELCAWDDMLKDAAMWDVVRQAGGLLSAPAMAKSAPSTVSRDQCQRWIERLPEHIVQGYHGVMIDGHPTGVPGHVDALTGLQGTVDHDTVMWSPLHSPAAPEGRPDDDIEIRLGDRHARRAAERALLKAAKALVQRRGEWRPAGKSFRAGTGELEMQKAPLGVWAALETLRDGWLQGEEAAVPVAEIKVA